MSGPRAARVVFGEGWISLSDVYFSFINSLTGWIRTFQSARFLQPDLGFMNSLRCGIFWSHTRVLLRVGSSVSISEYQQQVHLFSEIFLHYLIHAAGP